MKQLLPIPKYILLLVCAIASILLLACTICASEIHEQKLELDELDHIYKGTVKELTTTIQEDQAALKEQKARFETLVQALNHKSELMFQIEKDGTGITTDPTVTAAMKYTNQILIDAGVIYDIQPCY